MNYARSAGLAAPASIGALYSPLTVAAVLLASGALAVLTLSWLRRRHDRAAAG